LIEKRDRNLLRQRKGEKKKGRGRQVQRKREKENSLRKGK
jgi:hypothetical protein